MVIDMNEAQVRQVLAGTQVMEFQGAAGDEGRYSWIDTVLRRFDYRHLARVDRRPVLAYLQRLSGYSRAQITRLVYAGTPASRWSRTTARHVARLPACTRPSTWRLWLKWTAPWARCRAQPQPAF
jgi:hypothetical protein